MSRFFSDKYSSLVPYTPGEQPRGREYIKLNTNESPFPPSDGVLKAVSAECPLLRFYSDPECSALRAAASRVFGVSESKIMMVNGSDEALNFAFAAFADENSPLAFPDITYGFYPVFAQLNRIPYVELPLREDFSLSYEDYIGINRTIVIANPNAPTGLYITPEMIERIAKSNPDNVVIIDEAYIDFGGTSAMPLVEKYDNLLIIGTFSKSRSLAGARLGFAVGNEALISDLNTVRYSTNPYNVNRLTARAGIAALDDNDYYMNNCRIIERERERISASLTSLGFNVIPSKANFILAKSNRIDGKSLYLALKEKGILVRHFDKERINDYCRITVGTREQMDTLFGAINEIYGENGL